MSRDPDEVVASFDSASVLHAATVASLEHRRFPHLGNSETFARLVRIGGHLPWPLLKQVYARIGGAEGVDPDDLSEVDMDAVATDFAEAYSAASYPAVLIGSSNGALTHLAAAMQVPWLPGTVLVPVHRVGDPHRADEALDFGRRVGPRLLDANPGIVLHQIHDEAQDEIMTARMTYFRTKWSSLPAAYLSFLEERLEPGAPVILVHDESRWPVTRVDERHVFQTGGRGGLSPEEYLARPHAPAADDEAPEAEWGSDAGFREAVRSWCADSGHPVVEVRVDGPQEAAHPVATVLREWTRSRGGDGDRLIVPSFILGDPWHTIELARVPFWTFFPVRSALESLEFHLAHADAYATAEVFVFQHGADSEGRATPRDFERVLRDAGVEPRLIALERDKSPHDIGAMARYASFLDREPEVDIPWRVLPVAEALGGLARVVGERGRSILAP